jgi:hypothetical protein
MLAGFSILDDLNRDSMLNVVQGFHRVSAKPEAYEISARSQKDFAEKETSTPLSARIEPDELSFLPAVSV